MNDHLTTLRNLAAYLSEHETNLTRADHEALAWALETLEAQHAALEAALPWLLDDDWHGGPSAMVEVDKAFAKYKEAVTWQH